MLQTRRSLPSFCVVVPMYNEEQNAERCITALSQVLKTFPHRSAIIAVDDGSSDSTASILERLRGQFDKLIVSSHAANGGYGEAIRTGISKAREEGFEYALFMDSDLTNDPKYISDFVKKMEEGFDLIKASRYMSGGGMSGVPLHRMVISVLGNKVAGLLMGLPLTDFTNGFQAVKMDILSQMPLSEGGFAIIMEELYYMRRLARTFVEIPNVLVSRDKGKGTSKFSYKPSTIWSYFKYVLKAFFNPPS